MFLFGKTLRCLFLIIVLHTAVSESLSRTKYLSQNVTLIEVEDKMKVNWDEVDLLITQINTCTAAIKPIFTWSASIYQQLYITHKMLGDVFFRDHKKVKIRTYMARLAYVLVSGLKAKAAQDYTVAVNSAIGKCKAEIRTYSDSNRLTFSLDKTKCWDAFLTWTGSAKVVYVKKQHTLAALSSILGDIDSNLDATRRAGVAVKTTLTIIEGAGGILSSAVAPLKAAGLNHIAKAGNALINAAWDDMTDDEKFIYGLVSSFLTTFQKMAQTSGNKVSIFSQIKYNFLVDKSEELHYRILKIALHFLTITEGFRYVESVVLTKGIVKWDDLLRVDGSGLVDDAKKFTPGDDLVTLVAKIDAFKLSTRNFIVLDHLYSVADIDTFITACSTKIGSIFENTRMRFRVPLLLTPKFEYDEAPIDVNKVLPEDLNYLE